MKHEPVTALYLLLLFTLTQFVGLVVTQYYYTQSLPYSLEPPPVSGGWSVSYLIGGIVFVTVIFYLFTKLRFEKFLKIWFSVAIIMSLSVSLSVFIGEIMAFILAVVLTIIRLYSKDLYIHNLTEIFIYGGIVAIFTPLFNPLTALILLVIIAVYDFVSVIITKHMVELAKTQSSVNVFTGLIVSHKGDTAVLGGGDIAFSLLFANILGKTFGLVYAYLCVYLVIASIAVLTLFGKKNKYYPAMPFVTAACAISYLITIL